MQFSIAKDFSRFPAGRNKEDGKYSGEHLREVVLALLRKGPLTIDFNGTLGYGSSFLEGAFYGLENEIPVKYLELVCKQDPTIVTEVWSYVKSSDFR